MTPEAKPDVLSQAKPDNTSVVPVPTDPTARAQSSPLTAVGDGGKMLLYLVPTLLLIVGGLHLLKRFQERTGRMPAVVGALGRSQMLGASHKAPTGHIGTRLNGNPSPAARGGGLWRVLRPTVAARSAGQGSIRLVETVTLGGSCLHLIEVRGRTLLLGANAAGISLLTEINDQDDPRHDAFRHLLSEAASDLDELDLIEPEMPIFTVMDALEEQMRDAGSAVVRHSRRLQTVQETETGLRGE